MDIGPKGPLKGTLEDLCTEDSTRSTAWKFYLNLKKVRPGQDNQVLPKGYMSICAFLASQHTANLDVSFKDAFKKTGLNSDIHFWQNLQEIEKILLEAAASTTSPRLHYSLLPTYESRCEHCKKCNTKCYVIPHVSGKRQSQKCIWCFSMKRPCAPNCDVQDNPDDDLQWSPPAKKRSLDERCKKIEQRGEKPVQKQAAKRTDCPELPPFNATPSTATPSTTSAGPSAPRQPAPSSSTLTATPVVQESVSKLARPMISTLSVTSVAAAKPAASSPAEPSRQHTDSEMPPSSQPPPQAKPTTPTQPAGKTTSGTSLQVHRKPGPGRSSVGLVPLGACSDSSAPPASINANAVAGPSSSVSQPRKPPSAGAGKTPSRASTQNTSARTTTASTASQGSSSVKKERPATGSGSASTPGRRLSSSQTQAPVPQSQQREPPVFDFGSGGVTAFESLQIPTTLEPAIDLGPVQRPSHRARAGGSPKTGSSKPPITPAKRPPDDASPQTSKKRRINIVHASTAGFQEPPSPVNVSPTTPRSNQPGAQPTPPHSRKHSPARGSSVSQPSSPVLPPTAPLASSPLGLSQLSREIEELPSLGSPRTRLPTPISPLSRAATLPAFDEGSASLHPGSSAREASRFSRDSSPRYPMRPLLPTPRSSLSAPVVTPPVSSAEQRRPTVPVDVVMQDSISAPPPTPPRSGTPQPSAIPLPAVLTPAGAPAFVPPPAPVLVQSAAARPVAVPPAVPASASIVVPVPPPPAPSASASPSATAQAPAPAAPTASPIPEPYIQLVYRKAHELAAHLGAHGCAQLELRCALRDMAGRLARIDALRRQGEAARARSFDGLLLGAAGAVVACRAELRRRGEPVVDDVLDMLVEELEERLQTLREAVPEV